MRTYIENILQEKTKDTRANIFYTQWQVAKEYVPQVLNTISHIFPHYSLHDSTHSDTIINNIVRIVGKDVISKFSAIDLWLLLSSAYYHDIGMAVFAKDFDKIFNGNDFKDFLKEVQNDTRSSLYEYANLLLINGDKIYYKDCEFNSKSYEGSRFLIAEFIRRQHAERSKGSIISDISINLPGNSIPSRIINILSNICLSHGKSFEDVMKIPFSETSIDFEDCHPRYIACLLRLGDLLDLDNNRFSEVILQTLSNIPLDSILHDKKHRSIEHIRIDKQRIEIIATCEEYEEADITNRWFEFLDDEISNQMKKWNEIVPCVDYGFLPTLGNLIVELKDYDTIDGKLRPSFNIDPQKSIELLQGAGLYNEPHQCFRELLQNAVDATLLKIYSDSKQKLDYDSFKVKCKDYPINIEINNKESNNDSDYIIWDITITDKGIGMSKDDICYLTRTGSSNKNLEKRKKVETMQEWMKPSGTFGIGFQSVFLLTDKVNILTRKLNRENTLNLELYNPVGKKEGAILLKTYFDSEKEVGTTLNFELKTEKIPNTWSVNSAETFVSATIYSYDFVKDKSLDIDIARIIQEVYNFNSSSYIRVELKIDGKRIDFINEQIVKFDDFDDNLEFSFGYYGGGMQVYYRNQYIKKSINSLKFLSFNINILKGNAKNILALNRNEIRSEYKPELRKNIIDSVLKILKTKYCDFDNDILKQHASMFIHYYSTDEISGFDDWKSYNFEYKLSDNDVRSISLGDLFSKYETIILANKDGNDNEPFNVEIANNTFTIKNKRHKLSDIMDFIKNKCSKEGFDFISLDGDNSIILSKNDNKGEYLQDLKSWFALSMYRRHYSRFVMPCNSKYQALELSKKNILAYDHTFFGYSGEYPLMICPYNCKFEIEFMFPYVKGYEKSCDDDLFNIVYENRKNNDTTIDEIKEAYNIFIEDTKEIINQINNEREKLY